MKRLARQVAVLLMAAALFASVSAWLWWKRGKWDVFCDHSILLSEISESKERVLWVDARSEKDFGQKHIPSAVRLTEDDWNELLPELLKAWEPDSMVVVYCSSHKCHASEEVAKRLREEVGLKPVFVLRGGWEAWKGAQR
jgi:rhodanese-related sulfurtransferase